MDDFQQVLLQATSTNDKRDLVKTAAVTSLAGGICVLEFYWLFTHAPSWLFCHLLGAVFVIDELRLRNLEERVYTIDLSDERNAEAFLQEVADAAARNEALGVA